MSINYFELLELEPTDNWDEIEERIGERKRESDRASLFNQTEQLRAKNFQAHHTEMYNVLHDPAQRQVQINERQEQIREIEKAEESIINIAVGMLQARGNYLEEDVDRIVSRLKRLQRSDVISKLKSHGVPLAEKTAHLKTKVSSFTSQGRSIDRDLAALGFKTLYEYLGHRLSPRSTEKAVALACDDRKRTINELVQDDVEHKLHTAIFGRAKKLVDEPFRSEYDSYLEEKNLKKLNLFIEIAGGPDRVIGERELASIIEHAADDSLSEIQIRDHVRAWVVRNKGSFVAGLDRSPELLKCGHCERLAKTSDDKNCHNCGKSLRMDCPGVNCTASVPTANRCCTKCGCPTGDAPRVFDLMEQARVALEASELGVAKKRTNEAVSYWPDYRAAMELLARISTIELDLNSAREARIAKDELAKSLDEFDRLMKSTAAEDLKAARSLLNGLNNRWPEEPAVLNALQRLENHDQRQQDDVERATRNAECRNAIEGLCAEKKYSQVKSRMAAVTLTDLFDVQELSELRDKVRSALSLAEQAHKTALSQHNLGQFEDATRSLDLALSHCADYSHAMMTRSRWTSQTSPTIDSTVLAPEAKPMSRKVAIGVVAITLFGAATAVCFWFFAGRELEEIYELAVAHERQRAVNVLEHYVTSDADQVEVADFLVKRGQQLARRAQGEFSPEELDQQLNLWEAAADVFYVAGVAGHRDANSVVGECLAKKASLLAAHNRHVEARTIYKEAASHFKIAADRYTAEKDDSYAKECNDNRDGCLKIAAQLQEKN